MMRVSYLVCVLVVKTLHPRSPVQLTPQQLVLFDESVKLVGQVIVLSLQDR
jgi:hypothetical protein